MKNMASVTTAFKINLLVWTLVLYSGCSEANQQRPHIVFIIADDLGWNDVGFHGSNQIPTPNIDALAYDGIILNNYYVSPICTPSRSALMTGKHPIHTGMQHTVLFGAEPRGLPLNEKLLPEYLKELGYATHIVGKWHLGSYKLDYTPMRRGFDSHLGYWTGHHDYFDHTAVETSFWGLDMRRGFEPAWDLHGQYSTEIFTKQAESLILDHNTSVPMFLYLAHAAVHSGNPYNPLPVPDDEVQKVKNIENYNRRKYAAMVKMLDDSVGKVVRALNLARMLKDTIIVFTTDNGGPAEGFNQNAASNWPLRGVKNTLWEGGVRGAGLIWSKKLETTRRVSDQLFHITDWLPTLYTAAGGDTENLADIDGFDSWAALSCNFKTNRTKVLHNIDDIYGNAALTVGKWKIVKGSTYNGTWDGWYGPSGRNTSSTYNFENIANSMAAKAIHNESSGPTGPEMRVIRESTQVECTAIVDDQALLDGSTECDPFNATCLFNIKADPCERHNLADKYSKIVIQMEEELANLNTTAIPPGNLDIDPRGNPDLWGHVWTNFGDDSVNTNNVN